MSHRLIAPNYRLTTWARYRSLNYPTERIHCNLGFRRPVWLSGITFAATASPVRCTPSLPVHVFMDRRFPLEELWAIYTIGTGRWSLADYVKLEPGESDELIACFNEPLIFSFCPAVKSSEYSCVQPDSYW